MTAMTVVVGGGGDSMGKGGRGGKGGEGGGRGGKGGEGGGKTKKKIESK
ncbi:hypothetical protein BSKO_02896 [Bryopsis sp. KO-2023]|nr:hypothetical protein BSKO_02896 [Bryopsis sp. KO-2023]